MTDLRGSAAAAGCPVDGTLVLRPVHDPRSGDFGLPNPFTETRSELTQDAVFARVVDGADANWWQWYSRVNAAGGFLAQHAADIAGVLSDLITLGATHSLKTITSRVMQGQADWLREQIATNAEHQVHYQRWLAATGDHSIRYDHDGLTDENVRLRDAAEKAEAAAGDPHLPHDRNAIRTAYPTETQALTGLLPRLEG